MQSNKLFRWLSISLSLSVCARCCCFVIPCKSKQAHINHLYFLNRIRIQRRKRRRKKSAPKSNRNKTLLENCFSLGLTSHCIALKCDYAYMIVFVLWLSAQDRLLYAPSILYICCARGECAVHMREKLLHSITTTFNSDQHSIVESISNFLFLPIKF